MRFEQPVRAAASLAVLALLAACASQQPAKDQGAQQSAASSSQTTAPTTASPDTRTAPGQQRPIAGAQVNDPKSTLFQRSVYYDFDQYNIKTDYRNTVEAHARYLKDHPGANVTVEGNCDERGSREYNLALGQRRADGVKGMMTLLGVPERQIETVSFGEEKPRVPGHDEGAWSQNRRSDIVYRKLD